MKFRFVTSLLCCMMLLFTGCSSPAVSNLFAKMEECKVMGVVRDENGNPINDVEIVSGREIIRTNARGVFSLDKAKVKDDRCVISFKKDGYCSVTRSCSMQDMLNMDVIMLKKDESNKKVYGKATMSNNGGGEVKVGKMTVKVPSGAVDRLGMPYNGDVTAEVIYLDPNNKDFQTAMPGGDLEATRSDNSSTFLKSYGMVDVTLTDERGNALQLGKDSEAELTFPVPAGMEKNTPDSIPLWAFNEDKGLWEEEGMARYDSEAKVYKGMVKHFSWHNLDVPSERVTVKGKVQDCDGNGIEGVKVIVGQTSAYTKANGEYSVFIPQNTDVEIYVKSCDYYNYKEGKPEVVKGTMDAEVEAPTVKLPCMCNLTGTIKNSCGERPLSTVYIDYTINKEQFTSAPVWSNPNDGTFTIKFPKNASSMMLHVETKDGNSIPRPYFNINGDINAGEIEVCIESQEKEVLNVTYGDKTSKMVVNEQTLDVASDIGGIMGAVTQIINLFGGGEKIELSPRFITISSANGDSVLTIHVKDFVEGRSTYDAEVSYSANGTEASGKGFFTVVEKKDNNTLLTLSCALTSGKKNTPVTIAGMFSIPDMVNGMKVMGNIDHMPTSCPSLPKPIFATFQYMIDGHWITGGVYKETDYEGFKNKLIEAGAECVEEKTEKGLSSGIFYHKDFMVSIDPLRILVMDKPTSKEKKKYETTSYNDKQKKYEKKESEEFEISLLEKKAIYQTISTHPVIMKEK